MLIIDSLVTVAPLLAYYSQYSLIRQTKSVGAFSIDICGILILANIMRICFWFTTGYAFNLFVQSFLVIAIQGLLLDICIKVGYKKEGEQHKYGFWRWDKLDNFIIFSLIFAGCLGLFTLVCVKMEINNYGPVLGLCSLSLQATLGIPQLLHNHRNKSVVGLSMMMIFTWFIGDFFKTIYYVMKAQPFQFILSGAFQLAIDSMIVVQIMAYGDKQNQKYTNVKQQYQVEYTVAK